VRAGAAVAVGALLGVIFPQAPDEVRAVVEAIRRMDLTPHPMPGATRTAVGITGNVGSVDARPLEVLPGVLELIRVTKPYKLASREMHAADTHVRLPQTVIGPGTCTLIAGPCSVENEAMILRNHGLLVVGRTIPATFNLLYRMERSCEVQVMALSCNTKLVYPPQEVLEKTFDKLKPRPNLPNRNGELAWAALLRKLDRVDTSYRN